VRTTIANATIDDLIMVAAWLSPVDRMELAATRDPDDYEQLANDAFTSQYCKVALLDGLLPVFAFGARLLDEGRAQVWGFKTPRGPEAIRPVTRYLLRDLIPTLRAIGISRAVCFVHPDNHGSRRWLAHLGFSPRATHGEFGAPLIRYQRDEPDVGTG
jgi:hypothetical protein